jgi:hypothetical protein
MLIVFFAIEKTAPAEFMPQGTTVNLNYYKGLVGCLRNDVRWKQPKKNWKNIFVLHHHNTLCHMSIVICKFLADKKNTMSSSTILTTLSTLWFLAIPKNDSRIKAATKETLRVLMKDDFQSCFVSWQDHYNKCIDSYGDYFEGNCTLKLM